jgi:hypothetical protein
VTVSIRTTVRVNVHERALAALPYAEETRELLQRVVDDIADLARPAAPRRTGLGARSIQGRTAMTASGWVGAASWDVAHYYMGFQEQRDPFIRPALQAVRYV